MDKPLELLSRVARLVVTIGPLEVCHFRYIGGRAISLRVELSTSENADKQAKKSNSRVLSVGEANGQEINSENV
jgi:hypothetical protein